MEIKAVKDIDKAEIKKLWADAFNEQEPFLSWYFDNFWRFENSLCAKNEENVLTGALTLIPFNIRINNQSFKASYIAGVSVPEKFRMQGIAKKLMKAALNLQTERNEPISLLIPFNYDFYRKMGYEVCYERCISAVKTLNCKNNENIKLLCMSDLNEMNEIYKKYCKDKNGYVLRDEKAWGYILNRLPEQNTYAVGFYSQNKLMAYCVYINEKNKTVIHEIAGADEAKNALYMYAANFHENVITYTPDSFSSKSDTQTVPTVMARITDASLALKKLPESHLQIKITDEFLTNNNGVFSPGIGKISEDTDYFDVEMDIKYFTQWFMGYKSAKELLSDGKIGGGSQNVCELNRIIKKQTNYINLIMSEDF